MVRTIKKWMILGAFVLLLGCAFLVALGSFVFALQSAVFGKEYQAAQMESAGGENMGYFGGRWFWIEYETGRTDDSAFGSVLGDNGAAFGIQFDYRYTLQALLAYCVEDQPALYSMFVPFLNVDKYTLRGSQALANAWTIAFTYNKDDFIKKQKEFCSSRYYDPAEERLKRRGIRIEDRSEVCKGAILSFVFQGCSPGIDNAVIRAGITNESSDEEFIRKIYEYRRGLYSLYARRYTAEEATALALLQSMENDGGFSGNTGAFQSPCPSAYISSEYGPRNAPTAGASTFHRGRDYAAGHGTPIYATANGTVKRVEFNSIRGKFIVIDHGNGVESWYQHCSAIYASPGQSVTAGQSIAAIGTTGISTGAHLHFEIHENGNPVDPRNYLE